ncbi:MAG TPA: class I SAM-dependent methyltransferase [Chitinophagaceae bacterium]
MPVKGQHITKTVPPGKSSSAEFRDQYITLRHKEKRLYSDEQVRKLPEVQPGHPHYKEWVTRKRSADRLIRYIANIKKPVSILEVGCGNGWLSNKLSAISQSMVTGFDINQVELQQAKRVFGHRLNLKFTSRDPFVGAQDQSQFDIIVFAASVQYFSSLRKTISDALKVLKPDGTIHIIDSHFYELEEAAKAKQRTLDYFTSLGFPGFAAHYFHHSLSSLEEFNFRILYDPGSLLNKILRRKDPFHWVCIKKT